MSTPNQILDHAGYQWWMFRSTYDLLNKIEKAADPVRYALFESLTIYGRSLIFFFHPPVRKFADDWCTSDLAWKPPFNKDDLKILNEWRNETNKRVAHLTAQRETDLEKWKAEEVRRILEGYFIGLRAWLPGGFPANWSGDRPTRSNLLPFEAGVQGPTKPFHFSKGATGAAGR